MRNVPFYANHEDGLHCVMAAYKSLFDYFMNRKMTWPELEAFTGFKPGKVAWTPRSLVQFAAMGLDVRIIEPFDYRLYLQKGEGYLHEILSVEKADWLVKHSSLDDLSDALPAFFEKVPHEQRQVTLQDIDAMLAEGRLVTVTVDSAVLNDTADYNAHMILILDFVDGEYVVHDPGPPPYPARRLTPEVLWAAMGGDDNTASITGFMHKRQHNHRLDQYVIRQYPLLSRTYAARLVEEGKVLVNDKPSKPGYKLRELDTVTIEYDEAAAPEVPDIDLPVLYEDDDCIVINKPSGVLTHSVGKLHGEATVATFIRSRLHNQLAADPVSAGIRNSKVNQDNLRAGIVHRLDRATSGVIICAKNAEALAWLQKQFHDRKAIKTYVTVVPGRMDPVEAIIDMPIQRNPKAPATFRVGANGRPAVTRYRTLASNEKYSLLELLPQTGRTHQLRVHLANQHHPIVGDYMYDGQRADRLFLHALSLELTLPDGQRKTFTADLPPEFNRKVA